MLLVCPAQVQGCDNTGSRVEGRSPSSLHPPTLRPPTSQPPPPQPPNPRPPTPQPPTLQPPTPQIPTPRPSSSNTEGEGNIPPSPGRHTREDNENIEQQEGGSPQKRPRLDPPQVPTGQEQSQGEGHLELTQDSGNRVPPQADAGKGGKGGKGQQKRKQAAAAKPWAKMPRKAKTSKGA